MIIFTCDVGLLRWGYLWSRMSGTLTWGAMALWHIVDLVWDSRGWFFLQQELITSEMLFLSLVTLGKLIYRSYWSRFCYCLHLPGCPTGFRIVNYFNLAWWQRNWRSKFLDNFDKNLSLELWKFLFTICLISSKIFVFRCTIFAIYYPVRLIPIVISFLKIFQRDRLNTYVDAKSGYYVVLLAL